MFFGGDDEEADFSSATGRSKLASLFDNDHAASQVGNVSLTYKAPTEPKKRTDAVPTQSTGSTASPAVLCAGVAFAYKFKDDKYASEGKLGVAVIGSHANNDYKLLLYLTKEKPVAFAKINSTFLFTVQPNNYVNFYDDSRQSWSLMFESEATLLQFTKQVAMSKFTSGQSTGRDLVITQDLSPGEGHLLEAGDNIEIKYSGWQIENNAIGSAFESSQLFRFRIGKQKAIRAWEEGVVGMKKNGKRLLICSPSMATGGELKFPSGIPLVFEVEIVRVKFARERTDDASVPAAVPSSVPQVAIDGKDDDREDSFRAKSKSIEDQMSQQSSKTDKAKLISRMAKMGQPMLPVVVAPQTDNADAESSSPSPNIKPEVPSKPVQQHSGNVQHGTSASMPSAAAAAAVNIMPETAFIPQMAHMMGQQQPYQGQVSMAGMMPAATGQMSVYHPQLPLPFQAMMGYPGVSAAQPYGNMYPPSQIYPTPQPPQPPPPVSQSLGDSSVPMMLMETRNQNTEVRVSLSRVSDKIDRIAEKLDHLQSRQSSAVSLSNSMPTMEVGMLVSNIERIVMDNERLKKENLEKSSRVDEQNVKIAELLQRNQIYVEQSNAFLEQRNDSYKNTASQSQARVQSLEQEKVQLAMDLSMTTSQLSSCQLEIAALKKREGDLKQQLDRLVTADIQGREDVGSMRLRLAEQELRLDQLGAQLKEEQQDKRILTKQNEDLKENLNDVTMERDNLDKNLNEKKRKSSEEIARIEIEAKEIQTSLEAELTTLKNRLKLERNSTESTAAQKLTQIEDDLNREWKEKCDRLLSSAQEKHQRELAEVNNEKAWLQEKLDSMEAKLAEFKSLRSAHEQEKDDLKERLEQLGSWKEKYENLRSQATSMKERYEQRLKELEEERNAADDEREKAEQEQSKAQEKVRRLQMQLSSQPPPPSSLSSPGGASGQGENTRDVVVAEVKKIMNTVYRKLRQEFSPDVTYQGSDIQAVILENVKAITLEMVQNKGPSAATGGGSPVSVPRPSSASKEQNVVVRTIPSSTEQPPPSIPKSPSSSAADQTSQDPTKPESSHPVKLTTESSNQESANSTSPLRHATLPTGAGDTDIPSDLKARENPESSKNPGLVEKSAVHDAQKPSVDQDNLVNADERPNEIVKSEETSELQNVVASEQPLSENIDGDKVVVEDDDDSFASFGSGGGDRDYVGKVEEEGGIGERDSVVEKVDGTLEARTEEKSEEIVDDFVEASANGHSTAERNSRQNEETPDDDVKVKENSEVGVGGGGEGVGGGGGAEDDDGDLFGPVEKQETESKESKVQLASDPIPALTSDLDIGPPAAGGDVADPLRSAAEAEEVRKDDAPTVAVAKDIPLFGDDEEEGEKPSGVRKNPKNSSLFGGLDEEDDDDGLFSVASKSSSSSVPTEKKTSATGSRPSSAATTTTKPNSSSTNPNKSNAKPKRNESDDDLAQKPPPLPLFGDSDDDKDLDWLS